MAKSPRSQKTTVDPEEISHFGKDSRYWWDENGPFAPLHRLNPARMGYLRDVIVRHYNRQTTGLKPLQDLHILDIGCGGGLVCEPLARMGAAVSGIDADSNAIATAKDHACAAGLNINYQVASTDHMKSQFDVVLALEIIEHVASVDKFVDNCVNLCKPGGLIVFSTLNRTPKSFALGIIAAEYILRWVPTGTHNWKKFVRPAELASALRQAGALPQEMRGLRLNPLRQEFEIVENDVDVNYFMVALKPIAQTKRKKP
ncbi:MAG: bifunctional 2-polyprenyl-6-hydroxyphenol methylase/3-demethylubiquinol 3-O-methyltransferase UbiG [Micavibrio aeruginosavorus]|uniref:Bifunctional 2-polyprenyl-6-hydroxyphenol methylase/3-demethylubiquinol 3-O-methyltransferase UbiG n=1 Tax=Micavibrio aeruginosavorus TaxID=349221 RepID=A0A7T5R191_9BACT|nr:MAG: bifunctional 2-polyprenyl-6-hydroxyphenol methylase/3-demethylubiquinol 3-O-methyltransferase UbiG [Micavibrio aeruginosavorus]